MPDAVAAPAYRLLDGSAALGHARVEADGRVYDVWGYGPTTGWTTCYTLYPEDPTGRRVDRYECWPDKGLCDCGQRECQHLSLIAALREGGHL